MNDAKLEQLIKPIIKIYDDMQLELIMDIAMRLNTYTGVEGSLKWYLDKLQEIGGFNKENLKILSKYSKKSATEIKSILNDAGYDTTGLDKYKKYYDEGLLETNPTSIYESVAIKSIIDNAIKETNSIMETIQTKALEGAKQSYMNILTDSYIKVSSGIYSYEQVIKDALNKLAKDGFSTATYKNGKTLPLESTVRRDVLTKVHQLAGSIELENAKQLDTNLVYVTQHLGARIRTKYTKENYEVHADWQGKVYMLDGSDDKYSNFYEETGYREMLGLCGVNCRHHFYPTFEWETHPERIDPVENENTYKLSQKQREYERKSREFKRQQEIAKLLDDKDRLKKLNAKKKIFNQEYNQFLEENDLKRDFNREYVSESKKKLLTYKDITQKWLDNAKPNSHKVKDRKYFEHDDIKYKVDNKNVVLDYSNHEKDIAKWLEEKLGGEIYMLPRINKPDGISTADYLFRNEYWDLKDINGNGKNVLFHAIEDQEKQAHNFIFNIADSKLTNKELEERLNKLYSLKKVNWLDKVIIKRNNDVVLITQKSSPSD